VATSFTDIQPFVVPGGFSMSPPFLVENAESPRLHSSCSPQLFYQRPNLAASLLMSAITEMMLAGPENRNR
jgi:hypothetical protein